MANLGTATIIQQSILNAGNYSQQTVQIKHTGLTWPKVN